MAFPVDPGRTAHLEPALFSPVLCSRVVVLVPAPPGLAGCDLAPMLADMPPRADRCLASGRHIVLDHDGSRHRLWLPEPQARASLTAVLPGDRPCAARLAAIAGFLALARGEPDVVPPAARPSAFRARRLARMLAVLDMLAAATPERPATTHRIARKVLFPRLAISRGAQWKGSSERRQTQRFIAEALAMRDGGYRALLC